MSSCAIPSVKRSDIGVRLPRFVDHPDLERRRSLAQTLDSPAALKFQDGDPIIRDFKQMHLCALCMAKLVQKHGAGAIRRAEYRRIAARHRQILDGIAASNLGLVYSLYKTHRMGDVDGDEILSHGMMALARAIETFNPWRGFRFSTYACAAIIRAFHRCALRNAQRRRREPVSLEDRTERGRWCEIRHEEDSQYCLEQLQTILATDAAGLTRSEKDILSKRFPLNPTVRARTLADIGRRMNLSKERIRQLQKVALAKLRAALDRAGLPGRTQT